MIKRRYVIIISLVIIALLVGYFIASSQNYYKTEGKDFFALWLAPRLLLDGKNPYNPLDWISAYEKYGANWVMDSKYLYPLPLAIILIPIGILPINYAAVIWIALGIVAIISTIYIVLSILKNNWQYSYLIPIAFGIFLFRPVAVALRLGQLDWLILLFLVGGYYFWEKQDWLPGGMMIALTVLKPQIGIPLIFFLLIWQLRRHIWLGIIGAGLVLFSLFFIGWLFNHSWFWQWLEYGNTKVGSNICCTPTIWGLSSMICGFNLNCGFISGILLAITLSFLMLYLLLKIHQKDSSLAIGLSIPAALLVSPYLWTYSHIILVLPILLIVDILRQNKFPYLIVATFPLVIALISSVIVFISIRVGVDTISSIVPAVIGSILLLSNIHFIFQKKNQYQ